MAGLTYTTADSALKEDYMPAIREQINNAVMLLQQVEKNTTDIEGRRAVLSLHVKRSSGVGARVEGGTLPTAGNQGYAEERVPVKYNYGRIQLSGPVIRAMKSDRGSFTRAVQSESQGIANDLKRDVNRQLWGTTDGKIATCGTTSSSVTVVLATTTTAVQMRQLEVGMIVDIGTVAAPTTEATARTITAVDTANKTITVSGATFSTSGTDFVFRTGLNGTGSTQGVELTGLQTIVAASGSLFNVDPTTNPVWASQVDSNSGTLRSISESLVAKTMHNTEISGGVPLNLFVSSDGVHRSYANLLTALKRFTNTVEVKGGFKGLDITAGGGSVPLVWDRDCPSNKLFGLNTDHLFEYQTSDWEFMQEDGAVLFRVSGADAYEATLFKYHELTTDKRNAHALISDIIES